MPYFSIIDNNYFCVHGGLGKDLDIVKNSERIDRFDYHIRLNEMLWSDPKDDGVGIKYNSYRGLGYVWYEDITDEFLKKNNLNCIIRAHEVSSEGYHWCHNGKVLTIFSTPNYCGRCGNKASIMKIDNKLKDKFEIISFD